VQRIATDCNGLQCGSADSSTRNTGWECTALRCAALQDKSFTNLWWLTWGSFDPNDAADVHITWRNEWSHMFGEKARTKYIWLHDSLKVSTPLVHS
jgi:hypothetical protein